MILSHHSRIQEKLRHELGPDILQALEDPEVIEILLNEDEKLWVDTFEGKRFYKKYDSHRALNLINTIASISDVVVNHDHPDLGTELRLYHDGVPKLYRFQGLISPLVSSPIFAIRKPASRIIPMTEYVRQDIMTEGQKFMIERAIQNKKSILVAGGTGSGKTTLCNALLSELSRQFPRERIVILEDTVELQCAVEDKVQLRSSETRSLNDLLRYTMRLRPDRIIVGEVRGAEAHSLIKSWNTGHPGGVCTIHANSAVSALLRLEQLVLEAGVPVNPKAIAQAIDYVVFIRREKGENVKFVLESILQVIGYDFDQKEYKFSPSVK